MKSFAFKISALGLLAIVGLAQAANNPVPVPFTPAQQTQIEQIVHDYLLKNPQILVQVSQKLQEQQQTQMQAQEQQAQTKIPALSQALFHDPNSPVTGNPKGDVTLVEFFDYQCPHCRAMTATISALQKANPNLRVVYKSWPLFGGPSYFAAKAGLAAARQGKYEALHQALMNASIPFSNDEILGVAQSLGIDMQRLQQDMNDPSLNVDIKANQDLAKQLQLIGTPAFIIGKTDGSTKDSSFLVPGPSAQSVLQELIGKSTGF